MTAAHRKSRTTPRAARLPLAARKPRARPEPSARIAIVGSGRVGSALALALSRAGWPVTAIASRRLAPARALAGRCGAAVATTNPSVAALAADALVLAVPDRALPFLVRALAAEGIAAAGRRRPRIVLHTSGASGADVLAPLRSRGWAVGSFHPLLSFPKAPNAPPPLQGSAIAVDGDAAARRLARALAASLGARTLAIPPPERARYHLAACFASNYVVTLAWEATRLLEETGLSRARALAALLPLVRSTLANLESSGIPDALTGPVARGDDVTIARHAALLRRADPDRRELHRLLVTRTARLARDAGWLTPADLRRIDRALGPRRR